MYVTICVMYSINNYADSKASTEKTLVLSFKKNGTIECVENIFEIF